MSSVEPRFGSSDWRELKTLVDRCLDGQLNDQDVTFSRAAHLYVFFDARLSPPDWLTRDFRNTGDKIGLDLGQWRGADGQLIARETAGIGPGQSIDSEFSVWVRQVENAGVVRQGSAAGLSGLSAMYGIAASGFAED